MNPKPLSTTINNEIIVTDDEKSVRSNNSSNSNNYNNNNVNWNDKPKQCIWYQSVECSSVLDDAKKTITSSIEKRRRTNNDNNDHDATNRSPCQIWFP